MAKLSPQEERLTAGTTGETAAPRVKRILERLSGTRPVIDIERALYFTESFRETEGEPLILRWAKAMRHIAENIAVTIGAGLGCVVIFL